MKALKGLRVLDLTHAYNGPFCTTLLADNGADVIKFEPPEGDQCRTWGPIDEKSGESGFYAFLNRNKKGVTLNLKNEKAREIFYNMVKDADVVVENFRAGWVAAAWVMTIGGSACVLWSSLAIKPISMIYEKAEKVDMKLVLSIGSGCLAGVMAYVSVSYGFSAMSTKGIVFCISFAIGAILVFIHNKRPKARWLSDYLMTISMLVAMAAACFIF